MAKSSKRDKPVSEKRLAANRANAARSTGPRTPEGKARSAQNARKHGFAATVYTVICAEDPQDVVQLRADLIAVYRPVNSQELFALERMALAQASILRAALLEASLFTTGVNEAVADPRVYLENQLTAEAAPGHNRSYLMAEGFRRLCEEKGNDPWRVFLRYQAQAERNYRRALEEFERLKALRNELPNEPIVQPQPEDTESQPGETTPEPSCDWVPSRPGVIRPPAPDAPQPPTQRINGMESASQQRPL